MKTNVIKQPVQGGKQVAIIGLSLHFPKSDSLGAFWQHLMAEESLISEVPGTRWEKGDFFGDPRKETNKTNSIWGGFLDDADCFDASFFKISPREAAFMDPQQRIMLELAWKAIEDSGYRAGSLKGSRTGVFMGVCNTDYTELIEKNVQQIDAYILTGTSNSILSNRISYWFDFKGPSMTIDTACASSLVAIHQAVRSLENNECDYALAGGVNICWSTRRFIACSQSGMLSKEGKCKAFDEKADGYVRGEGGAILLLKFLDKAIEDGDHIYAVIKGVGTNHGGKTNSLTVTNPKAQADLIAEVYEKAGVGPDTVSYIETHGPGTPLGDPIEVHGLKTAFGHLYKKFRKKPKNSTCGLGSVKTNIGHLEAAAGIAGIMKVVAAMQYRVLPASINFHQLNSVIDLKNSPFYIVNERKPWEHEGKGPRRAGVSSFGFGGSNAHIILEEYAPRKASRRSGRGLPAAVGTPLLVPLSAKNAGRLREHADRFLAFLKIRKAGDAAREADFSGTADSEKLNIRDIAYTLQAGREAMDERVVFAVRDVQELIAQLEAFLQEKNTTACWKGNVTQESRILSALGQDVDSRAIVRGWIVKGEIHKIAELWVAGSSIDWELFYPRSKPQRISLPAYPFERERHWLSASEATGAAIATDSRSVLHPLLHENTSDFSEQRYSSTFTGAEFFLEDHKIKGEKILPGVAYLEMARAAVEQVSPPSEPGRTSILLRNIVWARPIHANGTPIRVHISLFPETEGEIAYEIYTEAHDRTETIAHSRGTAIFAHTSEIPPLNVEALQSQCRQRIFSSAECYQILQEMGLDYGPGQRGIETLYVGPRQVLAKLSLPSTVSNTLSTYVLHPSLMDSAFQASIGVMEPGTRNLYLPFALEALELRGACTKAMWALIRPSGGGKTGEKIQKLDIDLCDEQGVVCVRMQGFSSRAPEWNMRQDHEIGTLLLEPEWHAENAISFSEPLVYTHHVSFLCEVEGIDRQDLKSQIKQAECIWLDDRPKSMEDRYQSYALRIFETIQRMLKEKIKGKAIVQVIVPLQEEREVFLGLQGLLKTAYHENPNIIGQMIAIEPGETASGLAEKMKENSGIPLRTAVRYRSGKREIAGWREAPISQAKADHPWKNRGIYLITGGAGGLGRIIAKDIIKKAEATTVVLVGRSALSEAGRAQIKTLGGNIEYRQTDIANQDAVSALVTGIKKEYGALNGIIHAAGVLHDNYIIKKTNEEFAAVLLPKVYGTVNLDQATKNEHLDMFVLFSSAAGSIGNAGQSDYATANAFMDAYARYRNVLVKSGQRHGKTLSMNWPLWKEGGMQVDAETEKMLMKTTGMVPMQTRIGIEALYQSIAAGKEQSLVMEGNISRFRAVLETQPVLEATQASFPVKQAAPSSRPEEVGLKDKATKYLKKLLSSVLKLPPHQIEEDAPMEKYGIDSIMVMQLTGELEKNFGSLSKTLFFEYQNIRELTGYFLESHRDKLLALLGHEANAEEKPSLQKTRPQAPLATVENSPARRRRFVIAPQEQPQTARKSVLEIAVIGVAGRYPLARNVQEFWKNLKEGKDCITEIPKDRWDHNLYFDEDKNKEGKTYSKWGGFIDDVDKFDPLFFSISPREAEHMDPQERLFLQCAFETLEDAGYTRETVGPKVGVFVGTMWQEYQLYGAQEQIQGRPVALWGHVASMANRVSYFCNFQGPSMGVDTMCSSSLTAIHLACRSLQQGECEAAIAGGVNVTIHPNKYLLLAQNKFVSSKGRCESFGEGGDGYVPGEGVGAVLLKPLSKAIVDGDRIYGVVKGTALNHGGKTNGYTVPNPHAQASVIGQAIQEADIEPRSISYMEAHGTGTSLGDPIEMAGLNKVFQKYTADKQFCAIGSAKSNIGHCEGAAGIAGVTKVLLQLKNRQLVPSLHSTTLNPNIDFSATPFVVQQELAEWKRPIVSINGAAKEYPRIAGISSFGAGGSNAHIIIEEYIPNVEEARFTDITVENPAIIVLSAKNQERLKEQAKNLLEQITEGHYSNSELADMAYTLQVGREAMEERLGLITTSLRDIQEKLRRFIDGKDDKEELYRGQVKRNRDSLAVFAADEDMAQTIEAWISKRKYEKLLDLWVKGLSFDWHKLYGEVKPRRITLPTYPFARERCWVPVIGSAVTTDNPKIPHDTVQTHIHPLLQQNVSDLFTQRFSAVFTGDEFFLRDHIVNGRKTLPGVAYLEMARAAGAIAGRKEVTRITDVVWASPVIIAGDRKEVEIQLYANGKEVEYEIITHVGEETLVHGSGKMEFGKRKAEKDKINLEAIQRRCTHRISSDECYRALGEMGLSYGKSFQTIEKVWCNEKEAIGRLRSRTNNEGDDYLLSLPLMDGALQSILGLSFGNRTEQKTYVPFSLQQLSLEGRITPECYAYVRLENESRGLRKYAIDITDIEGVVLARLKGLVTMELKAPGAAKAQTHYYALRWDNVQEMAQEGSVEPVLVIDEGRPLTDRHDEKKTRIIRVRRGSDFKKINGNEYVSALDSKDDYKALFDALRKDDVEPGCVIYNRLGSNYYQDERVQEQLDSGMYSLLNLTKALMERKSERIRLVYLHGEKGINPADEGLSGFIKTVHQENPKYEYSMVRIEPAEQHRSLEIALKELSHSPSNDVEVRYEAGTRYVRRLAEQGPPEIEGAPDFVKERGVYLITGGAGGLGLIFAEYLASKAETKLVLTGRSELNADKDARLDKIRKLGSEVTYSRCDITKEDEVMSLIHGIRKRYGAITGIIHSAGVLRDSFIHKKTREEAEAVLGPKIRGLINLDQATQQEELDFFVVCSSITGVLGNLGQSDYAYANCFMDAYMRRREEQRKLGERSGRSVTINWPLWEAGGMQLDAETLTWMERKKGLVPLPTAQGLHIFERAMLSGEQQTTILYESAPKREKTVSQVNKTRKEKKTEQRDNDQGSLQTQTESYLKQVFSTLLKVTEDVLDADEELDNFGVDSIMMMKILNKLENKYGNPVDANAIAENKTIRGLAAYLIENEIVKAETIGSRAIKEDAAIDTADDSIDMEQVDSLVIPVKERAKKSRQRFIGVDEKHLHAQKKIAVIGMACRFPGAKTLEEYWKNIVDGRDVVTEAPKERWNVEDYFSADREKPNTTYSKWGGYIDDVELFDADYFAIGYEDGVVMDPQQRIMLELAQELLDRAGYRKDEMAKTKTGVFIGGGGCGYAEKNRKKMPEAGLKHLLVNNIQNMLAARISDFYDLRGPSEVMDTACSSSLVAIHRACRSIMNGESEMALSGGIQLLIDETTHIDFSAAGVLSEDGISHVFDERANGIVLGEGAGLVLLKDHDAAVRDGNQIFGVICGSAINNDGHTMGLTVPSLDGQREVIKDAIVTSGINPEDIGYLEAHGTGTLLGDPIEIRAASQVYGEYTKKKQFCAVGSVKANMGHLLRAAGVASFIKAILALYHKTIPATIHCERPHPRFRFEESAFYPALKTAPWETSGTLRRAALSSFGFGGTNCHVIVEEWGGAENDNLRRESLPLTQFNRRWLWPADYIHNEADIEQLYRDIFSKLRKGEITPSESIQLSRLDRL